MSERRGPVWGYQDLALFLSAVLPSLALAQVLLHAGRMLVPRWFATHATQTLVFQSFMYAFLLGALYLVIAWRYGEPFWSALGWSFPIPRAWLLLAAGPALTICLSALGALLHVPS